MLASGTILWDIAGVVMIASRGIEWIEQENVVSDTCARNTNTKEMYANFSPAKMRLQHFP
jgi:hypothetical protein